MRWFCTTESNGRRSLSARYLSAQQAGSLRVLRCENSETFGLILGGVGATCRRDHPLAAIAIANRSHKRGRSRNFFTGALAPSGEPATASPVGFLCNTAAVRRHDDNRFTARISALALAVVTRIPSVSVAAAAGIGGAVAVTRVSPAARALLYALVRPVVFNGRVARCRLVRPSAADGARAAAMIGAVMPIDRRMPVRIGAGAAPFIGLGRCRQRDQRYTEQDQQDIVHHGPPSTWSSATRWPETGLSSDRARGALARPPRSARAET